LPTRRLGAAFAQRAAAVDAPGLGIIFTHLLGSVNLQQQTLLTWLDSWSEAMQVLKSQAAPIRLLAEREIYYKAALEETLRGNHPADGLWTLLTTWTEMISTMPNQTHLQLPWIKALTALGFAGKDYLVRLEAFDSFLDLCETLVMGESAETR
ncbi:MAG: hypothetical protein MUO54_07195, partial [Anaerolineales bacterium]|nr:hypothetical protein [Anaerolineales bacterium]